MSTASRTTSGHAIRLIETKRTSEVRRLLRSAPARDPRLERRVRRIVDDVRSGGERALRAYAERFDGLDGPYEVTPNEMRRLAMTVAADVRRAISVAADNIRRVARRQLPARWRISPSSGVVVEQRVTPLERVGCYVPGGRYPLPSSLLMTAIPARVAGVREVIAVCPKPDPTVMRAAVEAGVDRFFTLGGAHAVAALAYGAGRVPAVAKIVGPGNAYVAAAKALVSRDCAIDFFAGPSEIVVVSARGNPAWIAADLIAQSEHDVDARAILLTPSRALALAVIAECDRQIPAEGPAREALARHGGVILTRTLDEAIALSEQIAPEHVVCDDEKTAARLTTAGTVFVGGLTAQALGDYATGSNHVLPTSGAARARGGLSSADFVRVSTVQRVSTTGLRAIGPAAVRLANAEGLTAHARSIAIRLPSPGHGRRPAGSISNRTLPKKRR